VLRSHPLIARFLLVIVLPLAIVGVALFSHIRQSLPPENASYRAPSLKDGVAISRDAHGVAFINARTDADAFFGLGFAHAQDRLW